MEYFNDPVRVAKELKFVLELGVELIPGAAQHILDVDAWDDFLGANKVCSIIELGTGSGSFSNVLESHVEYFFTFDNKLPDHNIENFYNADILQDVEFISRFILDAPYPLVLFCDNGDKPREVQLYSPFLDQGDFLAVHDFQIEIMPEDIPFNFDLVLNKGLTAFFRKQY